MSLLHRKNRLWEGSRMFLPEHREQLQTLRKKQQEKTLPELAEDQIEEFNWLLQEALHLESPIILDYIKEKQCQSFCGFVEELNTYESYLLIVNGQEKRKIFLDEIYHITPL